MARQYRSYTDEELLDALRTVNEDLGWASYRASTVARPYRQSYWHNRVRTLGRKKYGLCAEMAERKLLHDPTGRYRRKQKGKSAIGR